MTSFDNATILDGAKTRACDWSMSCQNRHLHDQSQNQNKHVQKHQSNANSTEIFWYHCCKKLPDHRGLRSLTQYTIFHTAGAPQHVHKLGTSSPPLSHTEPLRSTAASQIPQERSPSPPYPHVQTTPDSHTTQATTHTARILTGASQPHDVRSLGASTSKDPAHNSRRF